MNNDVLGVDVVDPLKDDLDYYLESYQDDDYATAYDEEYFYESLGLDELDVVNVDRVTHVSKKADDASATSSRIPSTRLPARLASRARRNSGNSPGHAWRMHGTNWSCWRVSRRYPLPVASPVKVMMRMVRRR